MLMCGAVSYLDQRSPPEEEPKQIRHDVITDHYGDRDNEPGGEFQNIKRRWDNVCVCVCVAENVSNK